MSMGTTHPNNTRRNPRDFFIAMSTIAVILVNVDDLDEYIGNVSDEKFDELTENYIREEVGRGNFMDTRIRYGVSDKTTSIVIEARVEDDINDSMFKQTIHESCMLPNEKGNFYVDDINSEESIEHTGE